MKVKLFTQSSSLHSRLEVFCKGKGSCSKCPYVSVHKTTTIERRQMRLRLEKVACTAQVGVGWGF